MKPTYEELERQLEESQREFRAADATIHNLELKLTDMAVQLANAESKCRELAAENAGLKSAAEFSTTPDMWIEQADGMLDYRYCEWYVDVLKAAMETPATDAFLAEVRAQAIRAALDESSDYLDTDCVMDRLDISYEDAELRTSGAIELHDALVAVANQLRKGE
ncbi:hypothetical protein [Citrobacter freundii]|uniref:Ead/Ea22-like family protein n=1 Tax=uncultured Citrobacter sp. TaxID=200446 RepID=A0A212I5F4_9ENTR|nr:hypothetical protein [Citrobacter freundii]MBJ9534146.1 hypothetical protein [Citrobacter freundii]MDU1170865.1 hypothetical protein [Citrobacter freundii]MDU1219424.1 hypothetical protein [Citrobacter freundii]QLZ05236.1 hypothetical protein HV103_09995 [Citrobacter freundii]SBV61808.1 conserved hypothetical protein [uncultured Citrobacter sp.]